MGPYGSKTLKPTQLWGSAWGPQTGIRNYTLLKQAILIMLIFFWDIVWKIKHVPNIYQQQFGTQSWNIFLNYHQPVYIPCSHAHCPSPSLPSLPRPYIPLMKKKASKRLRAKLAAKQKKAKKPLVRKTVSKTSGKLHVSRS